MTRLRNLALATMLFAPLAAAALYQAAQMIA